MNMNENVHPLTLMVFQEISFVLSVPLVKQKLPRKSFVFLLVLVVLHLQQTFIATVSA